ncbi:MAG: hypothetical protein IKU55_03385 [Clostridia bacterium]|nr:hypothetical protein [Clostridia bacterium]
MANYDAFLAALSSDDRLLVRHVMDKAALAEKTSRLTSTKFLTPAEVALVRRFCAFAAIRVIFDGGSAEAERCVALFPPPYCDGIDDEYLLEDSPVAILRASVKGDTVLTHRDYLGALMAAGVQREAVGDIEVHEHEAYLFCLTELVPYLSQNVTQAGRAPLTLSVIDRADLPPREAPDGEVLQATVSSLRLDALVAAGYHLSREDARAVIEQGLCSVDHLPVTKADAAVSEGILVSVRGKGRMKLTEVRGETRKGRLALTLFRYR